MLIKFLLAVICGVLSCTAWSKRELTQYEKLQIMARDYHFEYIQMVGYEERRPKINPRHKRKRSGLESLDRMLKRQLRHHHQQDHQNNVHDRSHQRPRQRHYRHARKAPVN